MLAGLRRVAQAAHSLRTDRTPDPVAQLPEIADLAGRLDGALDQVSQALTGAAPHPIPLMLRASHRALTDTVGDRAGAAIVLAELDELIDAVDTVGHLVGVEFGELPG